MGLEASWTNEQNKLYCDGFGLWKEWKNSVWQTCKITGSDVSGVRPRERLKMRYQCEKSVRCATDVSRLRKIDF